MVTTDLPGVSKDDVDIDIRDNKVWISANMHKESSEEKEGYLYANVHTAGLHVHSTCLRLYVKMMPVQSWKTECSQ
ncbi:MAG: Hsp20 family protein [Methanolobus sp.]